jgi:hypothetical protein
MCAIDALGIAPMFDRPIEISSRDPLTDDDVRAQLTAGGEGTWQPESAVVIAGAIDRSGDSFRGCCPVLNFFTSSDNGERWLVQHPGVRGQVVSMPEAIAAGRVVFGDVFPLAPLNEPPHGSPTSARGSFLIEIPGVAVAVPTHRPPRVPGDLEDYRRDDKADDRVGDGNAESHHRCAPNNADADEPVNTRMIPIGH